MGFDNECIVNIQSLAGEYFCPVCRLLVYPNEALQSQCTHLYCKPCLTYVVGTTRACPYDGYLVTEPDSKPLLESNKALAETIGKIAVRCLYHRSGCQWQGPLSDCTTHCSSCAYGNSAVVCNRCAVQIVHRQVQEHAQTCSGVQPQATQPDGAQNTVVAAPVNGGQPQTTTQLGTTTSMAPQTGTIPTTGQDPNLQASLNPQANGVAVGAVLTPEQLYQQQYYQQYPGYDPYQQAYQNYYPYPQQPQVYSQPPKVPQQPIQTQTPVQAQAPPQNQGQGQPQTLQNVNPPYQIAQPPAQMMPQAQPPSQGYPYPYPQSQPQQMLQYPQPQPQVQQHPQMPLQPHLQAHPQQLQQTQSYPHSQQMNQSLNPNAQPQTQQQTQAVTGHHSYPQPQAHQQMQMGTQQRPNLQPQSGSIPQLPPQMHGQYPPQSHPPVPNQQFPPQSQRPLNPYAQQPGHPPMQPLQQLVPQQHMPHQQAFSGQVTGPVQNQLRPHGQHVQLPPPPPLHPQMHQQPQSYSSRPMMPSQEAQPQGFAHSLAGYPGQAQGRPPHLGANQHLPSQNHHLRTSNQLHRNESPSLKPAENEANGLASTSGFGIESVQSVKLVGKEDVKDTSSELHKAESGGKSFDTGATEQKDDTDVSQKEENLTSSDKSKEGGADTGVQADTSQGYAKPEENKFGQVLGNGFTQPTHAFLPVDQGRGPNLPMQNPLTHQQRPYGPGQPLNMIRPQGPGHLPQPGQPFNPHIEHAQHPPFGRPPSQFVPHERNFELQHSGDPRMPLGKPTGSFNSSGGFMGRPPLYGVEGQIGQQRPIGLASNDIFPDSQPRYLNGQAPGTQSQVSRTLDKEPFGMNYDTGSKLETGAVGAPRFLPPYYSGGVNEPGSRVPDDNTGRGNFANPRSDFLRPVTGFGPHRMDRFSSRSPGRENAGFPPRDFGDLPGFPRNRPGIGNFEGGESRSFDGGHRPFSHFSRDELEGPGFQGPRSLPGHVRLGDPTGFGAFPGPARRGDLAGPENFPPYRPFSSSYPPPGSLDPFDNSRKRLLPNNGWCRICKVDCEGVEGLELHSQTREHQDMAMDMVRSIKLQNSKKQKMSNDRSSLEEPSKRRGAGYEVHDNRR